MCAQIGDHGKDLFPRLSWQNGYTKLTNITANDRVGKMFNCVLFLVTVNGAQVFAELKVDAKRIVHISKKKKGKEQKSATKYVGLTPKLICFQTLWRYSK